MKKNSKFENILDDCLERLVRGEAMERCLESYPEQALELEPLLRTAQVAREAAAIVPRAEFRARVRYEFRSALHDELSKKKQPRFSFRRGWVVALMVVGILLVSGGGTVLAASDSMPDSPLYPVKLATERVQMALTPSSVGKAQLCAKQADRRVAELIYLAAKGDAQEVEAATERLDERLTTLVMLVSPQGEAVPVDEGSPALTQEPALAPTAPPSPATETVPVPPTSPALEATPAPVYEEPPSEELDEGATDVPGKNGKAELKVTLTGYLESHPGALRDALDKVSPSVKAALIDAISNSEAAYREALAAMDD
jgi:outer membrane biosynthesis protein TonB